MLKLPGVVRGLVGSSMSLWRGTVVSDVGRRPSHRLHLYDIEGDGECQRVREVLTELDLDVVIFPCPVGGTRFRAQLLKIGGKDEVPFLVDAHRAVSAFGAADIIRHLYREYSESGKVPSRHRGVIPAVGAGLSRFSRLGAGRHAKPSKKPELLLELYSFESSPYAKLVRETLCELELPYITRNLGRTEWRDHLLPYVRERWFPDYRPKGRNRSALHAQTGKVMSPCLVDPNAGLRLFESDAIVAYLRQRYAI